MGTVSRARYVSNFESCLFKLMASQNDQNQHLENMEPEYKRARKDNIKRILKLAEKLCPIDYAKFVHTIYLELGLGYNQRASAANEPADRRCNGNED